MTLKSRQVIQKYLSDHRKAKLELLAELDKSSVCFLRVSCAKNARDAWLSLKERYKSTTVAEELQLVNKFNAMKLGAVWKNPVERICIPLDLVRARLQELGMEIPEKNNILQVIGNLPKEYNI